MKAFKYLLVVLVLAVTAVSCTEEVVGPVYEDDPIAVPPPRKP